MCLINVHQRERECECKEKRKDATENAARIIMCNNFRAYPDTNPNMLMKKLHPTHPSEPPTLFSQRNSLHCKVNPIKNAGAFAGLSERRIIRS